MSSDFEPWTFNVDNKTITQSVHHHNSSSSLGISFCLPMKLPSSPSTSMQWTTVAETSEHPQAQLRVACIKSDPMKAISIGVVIDDGFQTCAPTIEEALDKRVQHGEEEARQANEAAVQMQMMQQQQGSSSASTPPSSKFSIVKQEILSPKTAFAEFKLDGGVNFPTLTTREFVRLWNGMSVSAVAIMPSAPEASSSSSFETQLKDFEACYEMLTKTLYIDTSKLRLVDASEVKNTSTNQKSSSSSSSFYHLDRLVVLNPEMNVAVNLPLPRRSLLCDGASTLPIQHHTAPAVPGQVVCRLIDPVTEVSITLLALTVQDLGDAAPSPSSSKKGEEESAPIISTTPLWIRQVRANFHAGTSIAEIEPDGQMLTFTAPPLMASSSSPSSPKRLCCAARPVGPRLGSNPNYFLTIMASKLYEKNTGESEEEEEEEHKKMLSELKKTLVNLISTSRVFVTCSPSDSSGMEVKIAKDVLKNSSSSSSQATADPSNNSEPRCRYFVLQHQRATTTTSTSSSSSSSSPFDRVNPLGHNDAVELHMGLFGGRGNGLVSLVSRCVWGDDVICICDAIGVPIVRHSLMMIKSGKNTESIFQEARYRAMMTDPEGSAKASKVGSHDVLIMKPSRQALEAMSGRSGSGSGGEKGTKNLLEIGAGDNKQDEENNNKTASAAVAVSSATAASQGSEVVAASSSHGAGSNTQVIHLSKNVQSGSSCAAASVTFIQ